MDKMSVIELKAELRRRDLDTRGTKAVLIERLRATVGDGFDFNPQQRDLDQSVVPGDSVSQISQSCCKSQGSRVSSLSGRSSIRVTRAMEAAKRAGLMAKATSLRLVQEKEEEELRIRKGMEVEELKIRHDKEQLQVQAELEEIAAREQALAEFESSERGSRAASYTGEESRLPRTSMCTDMNADAPEFLPNSNVPERYSHIRPVDKHIGAHGPVHLLPSVPTVSGNSFQLDFSKPNVRYETGDNSKEVHKSTPGNQSISVTDGTNVPIHTNVQGNCAGLPDEKCNNSSSAKVRDNIPLPSQVSPNLMDTLISYNLKNLMPKVEIQKFGGDITQYRSFIRTFESTISSKLTNEEEKLNYLEQYTYGKPRDIVRACLHMAPGEGYQEARRLLHKRYGDEERIATAHVEQILKWPNIKADDVDGLDQFSVMLTSCKNAVIGGALGGREIEHPKTMRKILEKLPYFMQDRWRRVADRIWESGFRRILFSDLVDFIDEESRIMSNPLFGRHLLGQRKDSKSQGTEEKPRMVSKDRTRAKISCSAVTGEGRPQMTCMYCGKQHYLDECEDILKLSDRERKNFIHKNGCCFGCLRRGHLFKDCRRRRTCRICKGTHPTVLHRHSPLKEKESPCLSTEQSEAESCVKPVKVNARQVHEKDRTQRTGLAIIPVKIRASNGQLIPTYAFLDSGSTASFCTTSLFEKLDLQNIVPTQLSVSTVLGEGNKVSSLRVTGIEICDPDENNFISLPPVYTLEKIPVSVEDITTKEELECWPHLQSIDLPKFDVEIGLMIGSNVPEAMEPWELIHSPYQGGPFAFRTKLGWIVCGHVQNPNETRVRVNRIKVDDVSLDQMMVNLYNQEFKDLSSVKKGLSEEDRKWIRKVEDSCRPISNGHYEIAMPFREEVPALSDNRSMAMKRMEGLKRRFHKDKGLFKDYCKFMEDMIEKGHAEEVQDSDVNTEVKGIWYIPHHGVYHPHKPEKIRVVFDCAAKYQGKSLNDTLLQGPDLTNSLVEVLLRFRQSPYAFMADIESMFYQVSVPKSDRDCLRFLWWPDGDYNKCPSEYRMTVHLFGASSSPSCANFALHRTAIDHSNTQTLEARKTILSNFYVDDCLKSTETEKEIIQIAHDVKSLCSKGGFNLTKFVSNSRKLLESLSVNDRGKQVKTLDLCRDNLPTEKALGVCWNTELDTFTIAVSDKPRPLTKRGLLSTIGAMYDPLGMVSPFLLQGRIILQELCRLRLGWDEEIPQQQQKDWVEWKSLMADLKEVMMDRCIKPSNFGLGTCQVHHFADASEKGFGTVTYLRLCNQMNDVHCAFLYGKAHVAPLKSITIPRLELTAAALSVRVNQMVIRALEIPIQKIFFWTDSTTVIRYIRNERTRFHTFVANRLAVIHDGSQQEQWKFVNSNLNPADDASRGIQSTRWLNGPEFLYREESAWPQEPSVMLSVNEKDLEVKSVLSVCQPTEEENPIKRLLQYYSSWHKLKKAVAWMLRLKAYLIKFVPSEKRCSGDLKVGELNKSEKTIIQAIQEEAFHEEVVALRTHGRVNRNSRIAKLNPIMCDGLLRVGGRLTEAPIEFHAKHPIILPHKHHVTNLIIRDCHERVGHQGREHVLCALREKYWLVKGNASVRAVVRNCVTCKRYQAPVMQQQMANLPVDRVTPNEPPFTNTGLDCFGPFYTKRGRAQVKRYGVIFTCLAVRAVHIEVADSLSTDSFINALRRFIARRGQVKSVYCDRGTNFIGAERELREAIDHWDQGLINQSLLRKGIDWHFNPPYSSHFGGIWERQIRTVRKVLNGIMKEQTLNDDGLNTLMCEVESIINSRPLTTVSSDSQSCIPLTPNHLLTFRNSSFAIGEFNSRDLYCKKLWRHVQYLADLFWKRWKREYLISLQERQKWSNVRDNLTEGAVVMIVDENSPRCHWLLGRVVQINPSKDGLVRNAIIKSGKTMINRPLSKLVLLCEGSC